MSPPELPKENHIEDLVADMDNIDMTTQYGETVDNHSLRALEAETELLEEQIHGLLAEIAALKHVQKVQGYNQLLIDKLGVLQEQIDPLFSKMDTLVDVEAIGPLIGKVQTLLGEIEELASRLTQAPAQI